MDERYKRGKIYKLVSSQTDKIYIGSTITKLKKRFAVHKCLKTCNEILCFCDSDIKLIENYPCNNRKELETRERFYIEKNLDICVNIVIPTRTRKEREQTQTFKIKKKEYSREYKKTNREYLLEYAKTRKWYCEICDKDMSRGNKIRHEKTKIHLSNSARNFLI